MKFLISSLLILSLNVNQALAKTSENKDKITIFEISSGNVADVVAMGILTNQLPKSSHVLKNSFGTGFLAMRNAPDSALDKLFSVGLTVGEHVTIENNILEDQLKEFQLVMINYKKESALQELLRHLPNLVEKIGGGPNSVMFKIPKTSNGERALNQLKQEIMKLPMFMIGSASLDLTESFLFEVRSPRNEKTTELVEYAIKENLIPKDAVVLTNNFGSDFILLPTTTPYPLKMLNSLGFSVGQFGHIINQDFIGNNLPSQFVMVSVSNISTSQIMMENLAEDLNIRFVGHGPNTVIFQIPIGAIGQKEFNKISRQAKELGANVIGSGVYQKPNAVRIQSCGKVFIL